MPPALREAESRQAAMARRRASGTSEEPEGIAGSWLPDGVARPDRRAMAGCVMRGRRDPAGLGRERTGVHG